jgi:hypothetical protein
VMTSLCVVTRAAGFSGKGHIATADGATRLVSGRSVGTGKCAAAAGGACWTLAPAILAHSSRAEGHYGRIEAKYMYLS